jgi:AAHS family 4-hydroxybenzoate transporter-like MFS transporter
MDVVIFWTYVGMAIGAFAMPPLADRIGRRPVLALCALCFGVLSIAAVWAQTVTHMAILRGLSGIFFSAMLPVGLALLSEMTPRKWRAFFMAMALVLFSAGNAASGVIALVHKEFGWQSGFWVGGVLGFLALPLLLLIPESLAFRTRRTRPMRRFPSRSGCWIRPRSGAAKRSTTAPRAARAQSRTVRAAQPPYFLQTILLWIACFLSLGNIALLTNWMATFFQELGGSRSSSSRSRR